MKNFVCPGSQSFLKAPDVCGEREKTAQVYTIALC